MAQGKHYGSFAKGFADGLIAMMKLVMMQEMYQGRNLNAKERNDEMKRHHLAQEEIWRNKGLTKPGSVPDLEGQGGRAFDSKYGGAPVKGEDAEMRDHIIQWSQDHGKNPNEALAIWRQESTGGTNMVGDGKSSFGDFQFHFGGINPSMPNKGMGDDFLRDTGIDMRTAYNDKEARFKAADYALERASQKGWGDWANSVKATGVPIKWSNAAPAEKPTTTTADTGTGTGKVVTGGTTKTSTGQPVKTDDQGRAIDTTTGKPTARADLPTNQLAGGTDEEAMQIAVEENRKLKEQQDRDSPAPSPGSAAPMPRRSLPLDQQGPPAPPPGSGGRIGAIPPGPTVAAQDRPFVPPPESGYPESAQTLPVEPPRTTQLGPESPYAPPDLSVYTTNPPSPSDLPSSGVGASVHDSRQGPPQRTGAPPTVGATPSLAPASISSGPVDPSIIARQRMAAQLPQPRPNVGPTPSSVPPPAPPLDYPVARISDAAPRMPPRTTTPATAYPAGTIYGPPQSSAADKPSPAATPVSAVTPRVTQPAGNSRFVMVDRPNADPTQRNRGSPQGTALNLASLWGANPPLSERGGGSNVPSGQIASHGPTPYPGPTLNPSGRLALTGGNQAGPNDYRSAPTPMPPPRPQDLDSDIASASRKGGPIQRFANGGIPIRPTMGFQGGGYAPSGGGPSAPVTEPYVNRTATVPGYTYNPAVSSGENLLREQNQALYGTTSPGLSADFGSAYGKLTPDQQNWYIQSAVAGNYNQANANPYPVTPAPAAAAAAATPAPAKVVNPTTTTTVAPTTDTTVTDPTTTTTTGAPGLPNTITAKSYDPSVDATTGGKFTNTSGTGGTNYTVGTNDKLKTTSDNTISGVRKGGAIPARPMMRFAAGGGAAEASLLSPNYSGPKPGGGWAGTAYADMSPNQQTWANQQQTLLSQERANANNPGWSGWSQLSGTPAAIWPDAAPAAPTPIAEPAPTSTTTVAPITDTTVTDPTTTTSTGAPGLPNIITAKSYDPNVDATTGAGFANTSNAGGTNYSVGVNDALKTNSDGTISGSRKGGPITRRVRRYADGGGVDQSGDVSPSAMGMPPGLAQGGGQPIPPIYFNPATYAGAGAPIGRGVTQNSVPVYKAGAIPSLPMFRGGVVGYDDGGGVDPLETEAIYGGGAEPDDSGEEARDAAFNQQISADTTEKPPTLSAEPPYGGAEGYYAPPDAAQPAPQPTARPTAQPEEHGPPPGAAPWTPQISDNQGNPSRGFIAALTAGLHWLGEHLGLATPAQAGEAPRPTSSAIAGTPEIQTARVNFTQGNLPDGTPAMTKQQWDELADQNDPDHTLQGYVRNVATMEYAYKMLIYQGREAEASKLMASMLHYSQQNFQAHAELAAKHWYDGHAKEAVDEINEASDALVDGRHIVASLDPKTGEVQVTGTDLSGRDIWKQIAGPNALMHYLNGAANGSLGWTALETQAAKYDRTFSDMAKARAANVKQRGIDADTTAASAKFAPAPAPVTQQGNPPAAAPALPGPPPASAPLTTAQAEPAPSPGRSADTTTAQTAAPPSSADSNVVVDQRGTPIAGLSDRPGIPSGPTEVAQQPISLADATASPNQPAPTTAPVSDEASFDQIATSLNQQEARGRQQVERDAERLYPMKPFYPHSMVTSPAEEKAWKDANQTINEENGRTQNARNQYITAGQKSVSDAIAADRIRQQDKFRAIAATKLETGRQTFETTKEKSTREWDLTKPRPTQDVNRAFNLTPDETGQPTGKEPVAWIAESLGYTKTNRTPTGDVVVPDAAKVNANFNPEELQVISKAMMSGYHFSPDVDVPSITRAITLSLTDPSYVMSKSPNQISPDDTYNVPRTVVTVTHQGTNTHLTFVLPTEDYNNLLAIDNNRQANAKQASTLGEINTAKELLARPATVNESVAPLPAVGAAIQRIPQALPGLFPRFAPGQSPTDVLQRSRVGLPWSTEVPGRNAPPLKPLHPPPP